MSVENEVRGSDFSDHDLRELLGPIGGLACAFIEPVPEWLKAEARRFARTNPRPTLDELRLQVDHAVAVARGWDEPHDPTTMLHDALKSFYVLAWMEYLQGRLEAAQGQSPPRLDVGWASRVSFHPHRGPHRADPDYPNGREPDGSSPGVSH